MPGIIQAENNSTTYRPERCFCLGKILKLASLLCKSQPQIPFLNGDLWNNKKLTCCVNNIKKFVFTKVRVKNLTNIHKGLLEVGARLRGVGVLDFKAGGLG